MRESYYTPDEVAKSLGLHPNTVRKWLRAGRLSGVRVGNRWRVRERDLEAFLEPGKPTEGGEHDSCSGADTD